MVRPLDHVTVIQQINFAERVHQDLQTHPEISNLKSEVIEQQKIAAQSRQTRSVDKTERSRTIIHEKTTYDRVGRKKGSLSGNRRSRSIDLRA